MSLELIIIIAVIGFAVLLCFLLAIANFSGDRFLEKYEKMDKIGTGIDMTSIEYVDYLNSKYFDNKIQVIQIGARGGDAYGNGKIFLSTSTTVKSSLASFAIISHEMGHAKQDVEGKKLKRLIFLRKFGRIIGTLMMPSLLLGLIFLIIGSKFFIPGIVLIACGGLIFLTALLTKLITISIEKDASKNAMMFLQELLPEKELKLCKKFLNDAKLTYWADFLRVLFCWTAMSRKTRLFN